MNLSTFTIFAKSSQKVINLTNPLRLFEQTCIRNAGRLENPIFIIGAPRSGTTLLYQLLVANFNISYISNFISLLYTSPALASNIQTKFLPAYKPNQLNSDFGYVKGLSAPSEGKKVIDRLFNTSNLTTTKKTLSKINSNLGERIVIKNLRFSMQIEKLSKKFKAPYFIFIKRDPRYNAQSIVLAKRALYKEDAQTKWFSFHIPEKGKIMKEKDEIKQALLQVKFINDRIENSLKKFAHGNYTILEYENFTEDPEQVMRKLRQELGQDAKKGKISFTKSKAIRNSNKQRLSKNEWTRLEKLYRELYKS